MNDAVFVPAIMSVGLIFSLATILRDVFRWTTGRARERRTAIEAQTVLSDLLGRRSPPPSEIGILSRPSYLLSAIVLVGGALYVAIGSTANYLKDGGYVRDIGWLLAVSLALATVMGFLGAVSFAVFRVWPHPPAWTYSPLRTAPLTVTPGRHNRGPSWALTVSVWAAAVFTLIVSLMVGTGRSVALEIDQPILDWLVETEWLGRLSSVDVFGSTVISIGFVLLIGLSGFRCRVMALAYPLALVLSWVSVELIQDIVERRRPYQFGDTNSFPSGHMVQAVFLAGLVPLALGVLLSDRRVVVLSRAAGSIAVLWTAAHRIHTQDHWPLDAVGGAALGLTVVLITHWVLEHGSLHQNCTACQWSPDPGHTPWERGVFDLSAQTARVFALGGPLLAVASAAGLVVATMLIGLPVDPEGSGLSAAITGPAQIGFAGLTALAGLLALRWKATGAFLMALSATFLGLLASVQYRPVLTVALTAGLMIPAVITWLSWQPHETFGSIATLATITVIGLTATAFGGREIHNHFFGPTHPQSLAATLESDADWLWLGSVTTESATVVAGGFEPSEPVTLRYEQDPEGLGRELPSLRAETDEYGLARFELLDLVPDTQYAYAVGARESGDPVHQFETHADGPQSLVVALGSCARSESNGAVFDAIVAREPDLYLALGDLHYGNIESDKPIDHIEQFERSLGQPGQSALFRSIPTAYVWDDHDYGPNDAGKSSPSRLAVSTAYRLAVPHHGVDPDVESTIAQAFSIGRVRFVLTDTRSQREGQTMLGQEQLQWFLSEVTESSTTHALVVWVNPTPWISAVGTSDDDWSAKADERTLIADALVASDVSNLIMVSGDAHMVAIDDGTNSGYASDGSPGFAVLHAAALDRPGSDKGGPYSHGSFPGAGQYGLLEITDNGGAEIVVRMSGHTWDGKELVDLTTTFPLP